MFKDRAEAAYLLANKLIAYKDKEDVVVLTIPRGGVPMGCILAEALNAPLDVVLSKKIGHPFHKEFAIGSVTLNDVMLSPQAADAPDEYIKNEIEHVRGILKQRYEAYYGKKMPISLYNKTVIIIDDGVATGSTLISCISFIAKQNPKRIVVALPVSPPGTLKTIQELPAVNEIICLLTPEDFVAVGQYYDNFGQVSDAEVIELLSAIRS